MGLSSGQYTNLFEIIGEYVQRINDFVTIISDLETDRTQIETEMQANSAPINLYRDNTDTFEGFKSSALSWISTLTSKANDVLNNDELVLDNFNTTSGWNGILTELIADMATASQTIKSNTVTIGSVTAAKTNSTAGTVLLDKVLDGYNSPSSAFSSYEDYNGLDSELAPTSDSLQIICTKDSVTGNSTLDKETFEWGGTIGSEVYTTDVSGSNSGPTLRPLDSKTATYFTNADFETWTDGSTLGTWTKDLSPAPTRSASPYKGTYALSFVGNGSSAWKLTQSLASGAVNRYRRYCLACYIKGQSGISSGELEITLEGTGFTASSSEKISLNAAALAAATDWTLKHFYINMPTEIPSDFKLAINMTNTLTSGKTVLVDALNFGPVDYHGGINAVIVSGAGKFRKDDKFTFAVSNNNSGVFQTFFRKGIGIQLPSAGSPTIADALASD
tara:strand:- start:507 stop:1847 length:1341 start_codon:yes stop_codon:yes gene_type:complete